MANKTLSWNELSNVLRDAAEECCPKADRPRKPWINDETWALIKERNQMKITDYPSPSYNQLNKDVSRSCRRSKRQWLQEISKEAQHAYQTGNTRDVYI
jgi:hypothetical protein